MQKFFQGSKLQDCKLEAELKRIQNHCRQVNSVLKLGNNTGQHCMYVCACIRTAICGGVSGSVIRTLWWCVVRTLWWCVVRTLWWCVVRTLWWSVARTLWWCVAGGV